MPAVSRRPVLSAVPPPPVAETVSRVLSIDSALRNTGWAVLERVGRKNRAVAWGVLRNKPKVMLSTCLAEICQGLREVIREHRPTCCAIESTIYVQNFRTAITLGAARGAAIMAPAEAGLPIFEYPPRRVKQAVVGRGSADKDQVAFMVRALLQLSETPPHDAADALAIGLTHLESADPSSPWRRESSQV